MIPKRCENGLRCKDYLFKVNSTLEKLLRKLNEIENLQLNPKLRKLLIKLKTNF